MFKSNNKDSRMTSMMYIYLYLFFYIYTCKVDFEQVNVCWVVDFVYSSLVLFSIVQLLKNCVGRLLIFDYFFLVSLLTKPGKSIRRTNSLETLSSSYINGQWPRDNTTNSISVVSVILANQVTLNANSVSASNKFTQV